MPFDVERMWPADLDGDGDDELVLYGQSIAAFISPSPNFATSDCYQVIFTGELVDLAVGDPDGDGAQELAYTNATGVFVLDFAGP